MSSATVGGVKSWDCKDLFISTMVAAVVAKSFCMSKIPVTGPGGVSIKV